MKKFFYSLSALVGIATLVVWGLGGFHTGWTQTKIPITGVDEITGIEYTTYDDGFVAGIDFLGGGIAVAVVIAAITFVVQFIQSRKSV
ncbi:MAG: hypothetical protein AAGJ81_15245 [Verrucomicrobiota bacterium]